MNELKCSFQHEGKEPCNKFGQVHTLEQWSMLDLQFIMCDEHWQEFSKWADSVVSFIRENPRLTDNLLHPRVSWEERKRQEETVTNG